MTLRSPTLHITVLMTIVAASVGATSRPPTPYIDKGACPFEGCTYRTWIARKEVHLVAQPNSKKEIGVIHAGERVVGLTGEVHSIPLLVHAGENHPDPDNPDHVLIPKGAAYYVLHYQGECVWLCWYNGQLTQLENCSDKGPLPKATWWVKVQTSSGLVGWTISEPGDFEGQDGLA